METPEKEVCFCESYYNYVCHWCRERFAADRLEREKRRNNSEASETAENARANEQATE